jgi:FAD/FMN-containing dehydrogenase
VPTPPSSGQRIHTLRPGGPPVPSWDALGALGISQGELNQMIDALDPAGLGSIVLPGWPSYPLESQGNPLYSSRPQIIVKAGTVKDVQTALGWAHDHDWWVTCRSGGHSTAGYSLNDGMVLDLSNLHAVTIDATGQTMTVQPGATWGQVNKALDAYSLHVPGGGCPTVGVGGYMQGGGYGFTSRKWGMNCDNVLSAKVVLVNGRIATASAARNPDLLFALCGGTGGNFGVLVEITYRLHPLGDVWGFGIRWPLGQAAMALEVLQAEWMGEHGDPDVGWQAALDLQPTTLQATGQTNGTLTFMGMYLGDEPKGRDEIAPLLKVGTPDLVPVPSADPSTPPTRYVDVNEALFGLLPGIPTLAGQTVYEYKHAAYIGVEIARGDWQTILDDFETAGNTYDIAAIEPYGGAIGTPSTPNAFTHRNVLMDFFADSFYCEQWAYNGRDSAVRWIERFMGPTIAPYATGEVYQNYPWRGLDGWENRYWDAATFKKLTQVKAAADPDGFFHFEQGIPVNPDGSGGITIIPD